MRILMARANVQWLSPCGEAALPYAAEPPSLGRMWDWVPDLEPPGQSLDS